MKLWWLDKDGNKVPPPETPAEVILAIKRGETPSDEYLAEFEKATVKAKQR